MKYSILSSLEYESGKILLLCSRFNNVNTGNSTLPSSLLRRCLEWLSVSETYDLIRVCVVVNGFDDGSIGVVDEIENVTVFRGELKDLSDSSFLSDFDCMVFHGLDNNISPLIRTNVISYISNGGGVLFSDVHVDESNIEMFNDISVVYSTGSGVNVGSGNGKWTDDGKSSYIYRTDFSGIRIPMLNTIAESGFASGWSFLYVYDTDVADAGNEEANEEADTIFLSSDYDIPGAMIMGYYAAVYENGMIEIEF